MRGQLACLRFLLVDLDGVVYRGNTLLPGVSRFFQFLERHQIRYCLLTNNSTLTPEMYSRKLHTMGVSVPEESILTSGQAVALYLQRLAPGGTGVLVIGEEGLRRPLIEASYREEWSNPRFVVVGLDRDLTYQKLAKAALAIRRGARLVAANPDSTFPTEEGLIPGCGAIVAALEASSGQKATVVGKPNPEMLLLAMRRLGASAMEAAILGDRLDTDVMGGKAAGIATILVLTGVTARADLDSGQLEPDLICENLVELVDRWEREVGE